MAPQSRQSASWVPGVTHVRGRYKRCACRPCCVLQRAQPPSQPAVSRPGVLRARAWCEAATGRSQCAEHQCYTAGARPCRPCKQRPHAHLVECMQAAFRVISGRMVYASTPPPPVCGSTNGRGRARLPRPWMAGKLAPPPPAWPTGPAPPLPPAPCLLRRHVRQGPPLPSSPAPACEAAHQNHGQSRGLQQSCAGCQPPAP